ncbi:MAG: ATP synthase F1 subunit epsilon [bacterium]|nr:ATP synthase F1 subunit epsilon [bacterium]
MELGQKLNFNLVSPERLLFSAEVEMVTVPGEEGDMGILPGHAPVLSSLRAGLIEVYQEGEARQHFFVAEGFANIEGAGCTVLAEEAVPLAELEEVSLAKRVEEMKEHLGMARTEEEQKSVRSNLTLTYAKLEIIKRLKK